MEHPHDAVAGHAGALQAPLYPAEGVVALLDRLVDQIEVDLLSFRVPAAVGAREEQVRTVPDQGWEPPAPLVPQQYLLVSHSPS